MGKKVLPFSDENGYYEVRLESIGGLGANLAGKMLAELGALYMGLSASSFSSYGSEKKGSPVRAYIRFMEKEGQILRNAPVHQPHLLGVFHEAMAQKYPVFSGIRSESAVVINTVRKPEETAEVYEIGGGVSLYCLDASGISRRQGSRLNMVMLGALAAASGFMKLEGLEALCRDSLGKKYPAQLEVNLAGIRSGYEAASGMVYRADGNLGKKSQADVENFPQAPAGCGLCAMEEPYSPAFPGVDGGINPCPGNTAENDLSTSREGFMPAFHPEKCIHCGLCDTTCPDMVFQFEKEMRNGKKIAVNRGPVYQYCKGCLRCVKVCPVEALTVEEEK